MVKSSSSEFGRSSPAAARLARTGRSCFEVGDDIVLAALDDVGGDAGEPVERSEQLDERAALVLELAQAGGEVVERDLDLAAPLAQRAGQPVQLVDAPG